jgi:multimeric flavodoxin WrbA
MKTLILNGSPRKNGDTVSLLNILKKNLAGEVKIVDAYYCNVAPCIDCRYCWKNPGCCVKDEMQEIYAYIEECDNVLIASPVYFSELTGKLLDLGSRLQTYFSAKFFRKEQPVAKAKKAAVLLVGGGNGNMEKAYDTAQILLRDIHATDIFPLIGYHGTDHSVVAEDPDMQRKLNELCTFFNTEK